MKIIIRNGRVIDPAQNIDKIADVLIDGGVISQIKKSIVAKGAKEIDAKGKIVSPGFIDMHTHLREPGEEGKETIQSGVNAAIHGGFTTVCAMPNTHPTCDNTAQVNYILDRAKQAGLANVLPIGAITKKREGKELSEMHDLKRAGCLALSDDGDCIEDSGLMRRAMEYASMLDLLVIDHCEDKSLVKNGVMHEGYWSTVLGLKPISSESESIVVARNILLAELTGARIHIAHVSTAQSVNLIRQAKKKGVLVTAEVMPHHFTLTDEYVKNYDPRMKVNPPLRSKEDVKAIKTGLKDGTIDVIATDHAPHYQTDKEKEFDYAPFGMIGLETALSLSITQLVEKGILDWPKLIEKLTLNPAKILKYDRGHLSEGAVADITVIDPKKVWVYKEKDIKSISKNSPFIDWDMKGIATDVFVAGKQVLRRD